MAKFKIGDRVRVIDASDQFQRPHLGKVGVITDSGSDRLPMVRFDGCTFDVCFAECRLVAEQSELETLVATANAGVAARNTLYEKYPGQFEMDDPGRGWVTAQPTTMISGYRVNQKPAFEPFEIEVVGEPFPIKVKLDGGMLRIGCQSFVPDVLRSYLIDLCDRNALSAGNLSATRTGIAMEGTPHSISWADADKLLAALKKLEAK